MMNPKPATILCVDDEPAALGIRTLLLEAEGYRTVAAESGREALERFQSTAVDLAIIDYWMGGMNGVALAGELKRLAPELPIIILSGYAELPNETLGVAEVWIKKGGYTHDLLKKVKELLHK